MFKKDKSKINKFKYKSNNNNTKTNNKKKNKQFIPSSIFKGSIKNMIFTTRNGKTGYYKDNFYN